MAATAGGGKQSTVWKLERIAAASQARSRAASFMNTKEAYDPRGLSNAYNTNADFFGPPTSKISLK